MHVKPLTQVLPRLLLQVVPLQSLQRKAGNPPKTGQSDWLGLKFFREFENK